MKSLKKLTAVVAMAAVCLAMITPMTANAALACTHKMIETNEDGTVETTEHDYYYTTDLNGNGIPETAKGTCDVIVITRSYDYSCMCGLVSEGRVVEVTKIHWDCGE